MKKPKLELDLKPIIDKQVIERRHKKDQEIMVYTLTDLNPDKFDPSMLTRKAEYLNDSSIVGPLETWRYNGIFLFRIAILDKVGLHVQYLLNEKELPKNTN